MGDKDFMFAGDGWAERSSLVRYCLSWGRRMNNSDFVLAADGWVQISPVGDFNHAGAGVAQVIDREACDRIAAEFIGRKSDSNFPGVLMDFDHFSLDSELGVLVGFIAPAT